jgi:hypothetical protein
MERASPHVTPSTISVLAAWAAIAASGAAVALLLSLHVLSPEFSPAWRMISEYANGQYGWVLAAMFIAYGASSFDAGGGGRIAPEDAARYVSSRPGPARPVGNRSGVGCPVRSESGGTPRGGGSRWDPVSATGGDANQPQPGGHGSAGLCKEVDLACGQSNLGQHCPVGWRVSSR